MVESTAEGDPAGDVGVEGRSNRVIEFTLGNDLSQIGSDGWSQT